MDATPPIDPFGLVGHVIDGRYRIDAVVAQGGYGVVYRAAHVTLGGAIAFKALKVPQTFSADMQRAFVAQFRREAEIISRLEHPAIVRVSDYGVVPLNDGSHLPWMALEWIAGATLTEDLRARRGRGGRTPAECLELMRPVLGALEMAHQQGIAHRDLKPGNLMFRASDAAAPVARARGVPALPRLCLLDFGIAKVLDGDDGPGSGHTQTSSLMPSFSPTYAAPEQQTQTRTGPWTDVHALGLILTELLIDAAPYASRDKHGLAIEVLGAQRPTPGRFGKDVGPWEPVLVKALALNPNERFAHAGELLDALEEGLLRMGAAPTRTAPVATQPLRDEPVAVFPDPPPRRAGVGRWVVGGVGAAVAVGAVVALVRLSGATSVSPPTPPPAQPLVARDAAPADAPPAPIVAAVLPTSPEAMAPASPDAAPPADPPDAVVHQTLESPRERRAREAREREAALAAERAARPAPPPPPPPAPGPAANGGLSPMERVAECRSAGTDETTRNNCVINALRGRANSEQELRMLAATYQVAGRTQDAVRTMRTYINRYPQGSMVNSFNQYILRNTGG